MVAAAVRTQRTTVDSLSEGAVKRQLAIDEHRATLAALSQELSQLKGDTQRALDALQQESQRTQLTLDKECREGLKVASCPFPCSFAPNPGADFAWHLVCAAGREPRRS